MVLYKPALPYYHPIIVDYTGNFPEKIRPRLIKIMGTKKATLLGHVEKK